MRLCAGVCEGACESQVDSGPAQKRKITPCAGAAHGRGQCVRATEAMRVVDAFCGAGGWSAGAIAAGCTPVLGIDSDAAPLKLWATNCSPAGRAVCATIGEEAIEWPEAAARRARAPLATVHVALQGPRRQRLRHERRRRARRRALVRAARAREGLHELVPGERGDAGGRGVRGRARAAAPGPRRPPHARRGRLWRGLQPRAPHRLDPRGDQGAQGDARAARQRGRGPCRRRAAAARRVPQE